MIENNPTMVVGLEQTNSAPKRAYKKWPDIRQFINTLGYTIIGDCIQSQLSTATELQLQCTTCGYVHNKVRPTRLIMQHTRYGTRGCPGCNDKLKLSIQHSHMSTILDSIGTNQGVVLSGEFPTSQKVRTTFVATKCGHQLITTVFNLLYYHTTLCKQCSKQVQATLLREQSRINYAEQVNHDAQTFESYSKRVRLMTESTWKQYHIQLGSENYSRTATHLKSGHHLDHIIPVRVGYLLRLSPEIMCSVENLVLLDWKVNLSAREDLDKKLLLAPQLVLRVIELCTIHATKITCTNNGVLSNVPQYECSDYFINFPYLEHKAKGKTKRLSQSEFINRVAASRPDLTVVGQYINSYTTVTMRCSNDHEWPGRPTGIMLNGHGCPVCAKQKSIKNV